MKMKSNFIFAAALLFAVAGCDGSISPEYRQERSDKNYQRAMEEYRAGRVDDAIKYLSDAVKCSPGNASARFQLAVVLQESKKDYLGALCNFTEYLRMAEDSDKARVARDRMMICEKLLLGALVAENGIGDNSKTLKELDAVRAELAKAEKRLAETTGDFEKVSRRVVTLERENAQLSSMLKRLADTEDEPVSARPQPVAGRVSEADENAGGKSNVDISQVHGEPEKPLALNPEAKALFEEEEKQAEITGSNLLPLPSQDKESANQMKSDEKGDASSSPSAFYKKNIKQARPEFYVVEHGDTLMKIAKKFYGDRTAWKKIREANKGVVPMSGSVKVGDRLRLP